MHKQIIKESFGRKHDEKDIKMPNFNNYGAEHNAQHHGSDICGIGDRGGISF